MKNSNITISKDNYKVSILFNGQEIATYLLAELYFANKHFETFQTLSDKQINQYIKG